MGSKRSGLTSGATESGALGGVSFSTKHPEHQGDARAVWRLIGRFLHKKSLVVGDFCAIIESLMPIQKKNGFSRRVPDLVTEELVAVLSRKSSFEFKQLFEIVHENLRARNAASGGEEMLRLRAYEKLQNLVARGMVRKNGKKYKGLPAALATVNTGVPPIPVSTAR